jgi:phosphoribulokinase
MDGTRPLMLGLVGYGASGKTTLARGVVRLLGHNGVTPICLDDYHRYSRADRQARALTDADPAATDLELMGAHLSMLRAGGAIRKPVYDHRTGTHRAPETVAATGLILAYGMLTLTPSSLADLFDLTVYLEPDEALRKAWRLARDVRERGYTPDEVLALRDNRERDAARFIRVQRPLVDMVVRFHSTATPGALDIELLLRRGAQPDPTATLLARLADLAIADFTLTPALTDEDGRLSDRLLIGAAITPDAAAHVADALVEGMPAAQTAQLAALGQVRSGDQVAHSWPLALTQLLIVRRLADAGV